MAKYVMHKGREIPRTIVPDDVLAVRRLDMVHNYFQFWKEVLEKEFGIEKVKELAIKWGKQQGIHSGKVFNKYFKKKGINPADLATLCYESAKSSEIMGETYKAWVYDDGNKAVFQTLVCPTGKMFVELGLGAECCVKQCDQWMEGLYGPISQVGYKRTKGVDKDDFCEWELWVKK